MKLFFCPHCQDVMKLQDEERACKCGRSWGRYVDGLNATIGGSAVPIGFGNGSLADALEARPDDGKGSTFLAFVIPKRCESVVDVGDGAALEFVGPETKNREMMLAMAEELIRMERNR